MSAVYEVAGYAHEAAMFCEDCAELPDYGDPGASGWRCPKSGCGGGATGNDDGAYTCDDCGTEYEFDFDPIFAGDVTCDDACAECNVCLSCGEEHGPDDEDEADDGDDGEAEEDEEDDEGGENGGVGS